MNTLGDEAVKAGGSGGAIAEGDERDPAVKPRILWLRRAVVALAIGASGWFLADQLYHQADNLKDYFSSPWIVAAVVMCGLVYGVGLMLVCLAWRALLGGWSGQALNVRDATFIFATSNLMKYLPFSWLHLAGRYAALRQYKYTHGAIAWSLLAEMVLITAVAATLSLCFVFPMFMHYAATLGGWRLGAILAVAGIATAIGAGWFVLKRKLQSLGNWRNRWPALVVSMGFAISSYAGFFLINASLLEVLLGQPTKDVGSSLLTVVGILSLAWLVGLFSGVPAGLGLREAVLIAGLQWIGYAGDALGAALAYRLVTLIGDGIVGLVGLALRPIAPKVPTPHET